MQDQFYPKINNPEGLGKIMGLVVKIRSHLEAAKNGDRERESRLCNRIGQTRATWENFTDMPLEVQEVITESVSYLRSVGRKFDFVNPDPAWWISTRGGNRRW